ARARMPDIRHGSSSVVAPAASLEEEEIMRHSRNLVLTTVLGICPGFSLAQDAAPQARGSPAVPNTAEPPGWDPSVSTSQEIPRVVYDNVLQGLVRFDRTGEIVPALATEWSVSEDGLTWTFELRQGVTFHDGSSFDPEDVVEKFERAMDPDSGHTNSQYYESIESIEAVDERSEE